MTDGVDKIAFCREGKCQIRLAEEMVHMEMQLTAHKNPAALRRALIRQRDSKAPRDGLLFDQKQLAETDNYPRTDSASIIEHASEDMQARMEVGALLASAEYIQCLAKVYCKLSVLCSAILECVYITTTAFKSIILLQTSC